MTGATGDFSDIDGGLTQATLGFNDFWGLSATYAFEAPEMVEAKAHGATYRSNGDQPMPVHEGDHLEWDSGVPVGPIFDDRMLPST